jgi:hypothetical protein
MTAYPANAGSAPNPLPGQTFRSRREVRLGGEQLGWPLTPFLVRLGAAPLDLGAMLLAL